MADSLTQDITNYGEMVRHLNAIASNELPGNTLRQHGYDTMRWFGQHPAVAQTLRDQQMRRSQYHADQLTQPSGPPRYETSLLPPGMTSDSLYGSQPTPYSPPPNAFTGMRGDWQYEPDSSAGVR